MEGVRHRPPLCLRILGTYVDAGDAGGLLDALEGLLQGGAVPLLLSPCPGATALGLAAQLLSLQGSLLGLGTGGNTTETAALRHWTLRRVLLYGPSVLFSKEAF